jgi:hypothetical protein
MHDHADPHAQKGLGCKHGANNQELGICGQFSF